MTCTKKKGNRVGDELLLLLLEKKGFSACTSQL